MKLKFMLLFLLAIVVGSTAFTADVTSEKKIDKKELSTINKAAAVGCTPWQMVWPATIAPPDEDPALCMRVCYSQVLLFYVMGVPIYENVRTVEYDQCP